MVDTPLRGMKWAACQRQLYILAFIGEYGYINRKDLVEKFGISIPQASKDINNFIKDNPDTLRYNLSLRRYELKQTI